MDFHETKLKVWYVNSLVPYLSEQETQTVKVAQDTFVIMQSNLNTLYMHKVEASQILSNLNHSKLMMELRWLLLNKPFAP